ncbi:MAG: hypothetical protein DDT41_01519 [candidate division WS2 bacterium]|nr:hypothetical protein [Candidatus Psychracetigena formicireducens]
MNPKVEEIKPPEEVTEIKSPEGVKPVEDTKPAEGLKTEDIGKLIGILKEEEPEKKKRGRRKKGLEEITPEKLEIPDDAVVLIAKIPFFVISYLLKNKKYELDNYKAKVLVPAYKQLIDRYLPAYISDKPELVSIILIYSWHILECIEKTESQVSSLKS